MNDPFNSQGQSALPSAGSLWLLSKDISILLRRSPLIGLMLWPYFTNNPNHELYLWNLHNVVTLSWQVFMIYYALVVLALLVVFVFLSPLVVFALLPLSVAFAAITTVVSRIPWMPRSRSPTYTSRAGVKFLGESWLYVNGVCCDQTWLALNCEALAAMFGRRVVGIYNRTYGFVFDLLECIIQRDLGYITNDTKQLYAITMRELLDASNTKVVLIAHSQGGIIASLVVDRLLASVDHSILEKLELYTFGCAANHMRGEGVLHHIEHFANWRDYFARSGILAYVPDDQYDGCVYTDPNGTGHLLNMHYLKSTFVYGSAAMTSFMATYLYGGGGEALGAVIPSSFIVVLKEGKDVESFRPIFHDIRKRLKEHSDKIKIHREYTFIPSFHATFSPAMYDQIKCAPEVAYIEPDQEVKLSAIQAHPHIPSWGLTRISERDLDLNQSYHYPDAAGNNVTVYVIDSGVKIDHFEFDGIRAISPPDANFVPMERQGDENGHGTHISAIIGGTSYGVAKKVTIIGIKVFGANTDRGSSARTIAGMTWAAEHATSSLVQGRKVFNMSFHGFKDPLMNAIVDRLFLCDIPCIVAAGNNPDMNTGSGSPSGALHAYTVAATDATDHPYESNSWGRRVNIFAPGVDITSAWIGEQNAQMTQEGTSTASAYVAGVAALYLSVDPDLTVQKLYDRLTRSATGGVIGGYLRRSPNLIVFNEGRPDL